MADRNKIEYNWYEILGLEYYPAAEENEEKIKARIEEKRKEWLRKETDPLNGTKYKNYGELLKHGVIESEMLNSTKRKELIKDAQNKLFEPIDKFLRFFEGSIITSEKIQEIAARIKRKEDLIKKRIEENGKIELYDEKIYKNYCECINRKYEFLTVEQNLKILDKKNLYEFLDSENINAGRLDARGIIEAIKEKRKKLIKSDNETSAKKKLFTECEKIFGNGAKRNEYDEYLKYLKYIEVKKELEEIKSIYEITDKQISTEKSDNFNNIKNILSSEKEAKNVFIGFCEANKISYNITNSSSGSQKAHENDNNDAKRLSEAACDRALNAIENFRFNEAVKYLDEAKNYWSENPRIEMIRKRMNEKAGGSSGNNYSGNGQNKNNTGNNYYDSQNGNAATNSNSGINVILIVIGVILFIIMAVMVSLTVKNLSGKIYGDHETINGYTYLKDDSKTSTFEDTTTPWLDKLYVDGVNFYSNPEVNNAYKDYCSLVNEIEKVDRGIMPGTDKSFREVTYTEVDDAYKYYLKEISQIRQIFDLYNGNDDDLEMNAGCNYRGTKWNTNNNKYKAASFKSNEITERWNHYAGTI
jgi:putative ACT domain containing transcriptional regulator